MPWILSSNWKKMINFYYFRPPSHYICFSLSLLFFLSTDPNSISAALSPTSRFSDKTLIRISRDIFHCLLVTETLIKCLCLGPFASQVHGTLPCISGNQQPSSIIHNAHTVFSSEIFLYLTFLNLLRIPTSCWSSKDETLLMSHLSPLHSLSSPSHLIHESHVYVESYMFPVQVLQLWKIQDFPNK